MNIYQPYLVSTSADNILKQEHVVREYELFLMDIKDLFFVNKISQYLCIEKVILTPMNFYSGFLIEEQKEGFSAMDLRVNEGMHFVSPTENDLKLQIENLLHTLALDEDRVHVLRLKQEAKI